MPDVVLSLPSKNVMRAFALKAIFVAFSLYMVYVVREIWLPLSLAMILAMVLDPVVDRMEARGWSRTWAAAFIFSSFVIISVGLIILATPYIVNQAAGMEVQFQKYFPDHSKSGLLRSFHQMKVPDGIAQLATQSFGSFEAGLQKSTSSLTSYGMQFAGNVVWLVIIPIVSFYMLRDFHLILAKGLLLAPAKSRSKVQTAVSEITEIFGKYLRGLGLVSVLNGIATCILLAVLRVPNAMLLGIIAGILYSVPYVGAIITVALTAAVSFVGGGTQMMFVAVGASMVLHQVVFDQMISPRILGGHVGLHPILSIIALLCGNLLLGIVGMILAVPVAACIQLAVVAMLPKLAIEVEIAPDSPPGEETSLDATEQKRAAVTTAVEQVDEKMAALADEESTASDEPLKS